MTNDDFDSCVGFPEDSCKSRNYLKGIPYTYVYLRVSLNGDITWGWIILSIFTVIFYSEGNNYDP